MKLTKNMKKGFALALAAALVLPCLNLPLEQTQAADAIDTGAKCSLTVSVEISGTDAGNEVYLKDFNQMEIPVSLYRVADVDMTGLNYTPVNDFALGTNDVEPMDFGKIASDPASVTAADWQTWAEQADALREAKQAKAEDTVTAKKEEGNPGAGGNTAAAKATFTGLKVGLYLVAPAATYNPDYTVQYTFTPYLTALPSSEYALTGAGSDEWKYETTVGLKPSAEPQFGKLNIVKELQNYNETLGKTTFVFKIVGTDENGEVQYEEVASLSFENAGTDTVTVEKIPAGLNVTVREVYSGASYDIVGSKEDTALIWSDGAVSLGGQKEAEVHFQNAYDGHNRGGYGVTNHFELDENNEWDCENPTKPAEE